MTIEERLETLEREARRNRKMIRWLGVILGLCVGAWLATGVFLPQGLVAQDVAGEIRANKFVMVDEEGNDRMIMFVGENNHPYLNMLDNRGYPNIIMGISESEPGLLMFDKNLKNRITMQIYQDEPMFIVFDEEGVSRLNMRMYQGEPKLTIFDKEGNARMNMNIHENEPRLTITGERGNARIGMGVLGGESVLLMFDEQGNVIWGAP